MINSIKWTRIPSESLGLFDLTLPVGMVGTGNPPIVSITAMIHGDETAGLFALYKFSREYIPEFQFNGTICLIPVANPLGAFTCTRASLLDMLDMNRGGVGDSTGQITERVAHKLYELVKDSELVINFHEFEADSNLTCVYANTGTEKVRAKILKGILAFSPNIIWSVPSPDNIIEQRLLLSFDAMVANNGTPVFSIELPRSNLLTPDLLNQCLLNLRNTLCEFSVIKGTRMRSQSPIPVKRKAVYTPAMGIWNPAMKLMSHVEEGQIIGTLSTLPDFSDISYKSPMTGFVLQIRPAEVVRSSSIVFAIGALDEKLQVELNDINQ